METAADAFDDETPMESIFRLLRDQFDLDFSLYKTTRAEFNRGCSATHRVARIG